MGRKENLHVLMREGNEDALVSAREAWIVERDNRDLQDAFRGWNHEVE